MLDGQPENSTVHLSRSFWNTSQVLGRGEPHIAVEISTQKELEVPAMWPLTDMKLFSFYCPEDVVKDPDHLKASLE